MGKKRRPESLRIFLQIRILFELSLASSLRLLLTLYARLLVVLSLTNLLLNACLSAISLKPTKGAVQRFILFYDYT